MPISKPQARSSSDVELPVLNSPHERPSSPSSTNRPANPTAVVDELTPAYFPPLNDPSVHMSGPHADAPPAYKTDNPPVYSHRRRDSKEPVTWPMIAFRLGFVFPLFWFCGALALIKPQSSINRMFMSFFKDFAPSGQLGCHEDLPEADREVYLARVRVAEIRWGRRCFLAFALMLKLIIIAVIVVIAVTKA